MRRRLAVSSALLTGGLLLTGCASSSGNDPAPSASTTSGASGVSASGSFGDKPTLAIPTAAPPTALEKTVLKEGDGATVEKGQLLVVNYLGQTWAPKDGKPNVFDNSYDREAPTGFSIGTGGVIPGWDKGLVGQKVGSRVLLTVPPADGYGEQETGSIPAKSTLVFVVDIVDALDIAGKGASGTPVDAPAGFPEVTSTGDGKEPTVGKRDGAEPAKAQSAVVIKGDGEPLDLAGTLVAQAIQVNWKDGKVVGTTYGGQQPLQLTPEQVERVTGLGATLKGATTGSRVVVLLPKDAAGGTAGVLVLDLVGSY